MINKQPPRKKYAQSDIVAMLQDPNRRANKYSYLHPQISPSGASFHEDDDALAIVADAKRRYIAEGFMPNRKISESAEMKRDLTALMSMEGALTAAIHNAIQGYEMFDVKAGRETLSNLRRSPVKTIDIKPEEKVDDSAKLEKVEKPKLKVAKPESLPKQEGDAGEEEKVQPVAKKTVSGDKPNPDMFESSAYKKLIKTTGTSTKSPNLKQMKQMARKKNQESFTWEGNLYRNKNFATNKKRANWVIEGSNIKDSPKTKKKTAKEPKKAKPEFEMVES